MGIQARRFVNHQQMLILMNQTRQHRLSKAQFGNNSKAGDSPKLPSIPAGDPDAQQKIGNGVGRHGIAQAVSSNNEPLERQAA